MAAEGRGEVILALHIAIKIPMAGNLAEFAWVTCQNRRPSSASVTNQPSPAFTWHERAETVRSRNLCETPTPPSAYPPKTQSPYLSLRKGGISSQSNHNSKSELLRTRYRNHGLGTFFYSQTAPSSPVSSEVFSKAAQYPRSPTDVSLANFSLSLFCLLSSVDLLSSGTTST